MRRKRNNDDTLKISPVENWRVTFLDTITLLMTFFVLIFSMGTVSQDIFSEKLKAIRPPDMLKEIYPQKAVDVQHRIMASDSEYFAQLKLRLIKLALDEKSAFFISESDRGIIMMIPSNDIFEGSGLKFKPGYSKALGAIVSELKKTQDFISIEGYAGKPSENKADINSSLEMAAKILDYFIYEAGFSPERFSISGYGASRSQPVKKTWDAAVKDGRIEIVILKSMPYPEPDESVS
jgi:chemotaxis protein MotB